VSSLGQEGRAGSTSASGLLQSVTRRAEPLKPIVLGLIAAGVLACGLGLSVLAFATVVQGPNDGEKLTTVVAGVVMLVGFALATVGLGLAVFAPVKAGRAAASGGYGSHRVMLVTTAFATLLAALFGNVLSLAFILATGQREPRSLPAFLSAALSVSLVLLAVAYLRFIRPGVVKWSDFGFGRHSLGPDSARFAWPLNIVSGLSAGLVLVVLSGAVQWVLRLAGVQQTQLNDYTWIRSLPLPEFAVIWMAGAVLAPLSEEVFFRGLIFGSYYRTKGPLVAYAVSATVFALLHLNLPAIAPILVLGLGLAWLYRLTGSLTPCIIAHGCNNGLAFLVLYFAPQSLLSGGG
jgi:membrane protease YdiL (CAAX protease family)